MGDPVRAFGTAVILEADLLLNVEAVVSDGTSDFTFTTFLPNLLLGTYSPHGFLAHSAKQLRQWLFDRIIATAAINTKPPAVTSVDLSMGFPTSNVIAGVGTSLVHFHVGNLNCSTAVGVVRIKSFTFNNTNGWASLLGLAYADESAASKRVITPVFGQALEADGRYQPRFFYVCRAFYRDSGDIEEKPAYVTRQLANGAVSTSEFGKSEYHRTIEIVGQQRNMTGPSVAVGKFSGFGSGRHILNLLSIDETLLYGMTGTYKRTDQLATPMYLRIGDIAYPLRFKEVSGDSFVCMEALPASFTPQSGQDIEILSELHAKTLDWGRTGKSFFYEPTESTGRNSWTAKSYAPHKEGSWVIDHKKVGRIAFFTMKFEGKRILLPQLTAP